MAGGALGGLRRERLADQEPEWQADTDDGSMQAREGGVTTRAGREMDAYDRLPQCVRLAMADADRWVSAIVMARILAKGGSTAEALSGILRADKG